MPLCAIDFFDKGGAREISMEIPPDSKYEKEGGVYSDTVGYDKSG